MILPTIRQLKYLDALFETAHFGKAADQCAVSQPTLSVGIKELEDLLGVQLFERSKRHVIPTAIGAELAHRAQDIIRSLEGLVEASKRSGGPLSGPLRLGAIPTIGPFVLPHLLPLLRKNFPDAIPYLREDQSARLLKQLAAGELDVLILAFPYDVGNARTYEVGLDHFHLAVPKTHPLAKNQQIDLIDVPDKEMLLLEEGHCLRDHALAACNRSDNNRNDVVKGTSLYTLVQMVASGVGVTLIPDMAVDTDMCKSEDIATVPLDKSARPRGIGLVWRASSGRDADFQQLGKLMETLFKPETRKS